MLLTIARNHREKTIEGDLFSAFVAAGAISKANADDPKKSSLVRCARTDKGVHAAGNLISLKLIIEDPEIVQKINEKLSPQIRVFGLTRTNGSFNAYQFCDSRIYEYLIPTHVFLPPHPRSFLGKKLIELAKEADDFEGYLTRQKEVLNFWEDTEEEYIKPILEQLNPSVRHLVVEALYNAEASQLDAQDQVETGAQTNSRSLVDSAIGPNKDILVDLKAEPKSGLENPVQEQTLTKAEDTVLQLGDKTAEGTTRNMMIESCGNGTCNLGTTQLSPLDLAIKNLRIAYIAARNAYRIQPDRLARVRSSLSRYLGTHNFHNYTIHKNFRDPSAKRQIRSFVVNDQPIIINGTEWLSLKVHGQSFMMHQIRKMVSMVALVVRCGCHEGRLQDSYMQDRLSIPKAPGLGLLLERPVFDAYNEKLVGEFGRESIDFNKFEREMEEFKQREIYERIFREEERDHPFVPSVLCVWTPPSTIADTSAALGFTPSSPPLTTSNPLSSSIFLLSASQLRLDRFKVTQN